MGKTVRDLDPEDTQGALDAIEGAYLVAIDDKGPTVEMPHQKWFG